MINKQFDSILKNYSLEKKKPLKNNWIARVIRNELPRELETSVQLGREYLIKGSPGITNWAEVPWISVFDKEITTTAEKGYYIVYLFSADMSGCYLFLNQGWTQYKNMYGVKKARIQIRHNAEILQNILRSTLSDFSFDTINLKAHNDLGKGYELGNICGCYYPINRMPEDSILISDLRNLVEVYREVKSRIGTNIIEVEYLGEDEDDVEENEPNEKERILVNKAISKAKTSDEIREILRKYEEEFTDKEPKVRARRVKALVRNRRVADLIKQDANYICQICSELGFEKKKRGRYAEVHHVEELAKSGLDLPSNIICVCPRCHRIIHYGSTQELEKLKTNIHSSS